MEIRTIHDKFTADEFNRLEELKGSKTWRELILTLVNKEQRINN